VLLNACLMPMPDSVGGLGHQKCSASNRADHLQPVARQFRWCLDTWIRRETSRLRSTLPIVRWRHFSTYRLRTVFCVHEWKVGVVSVAAAAASAAAAAAAACGGAVGFQSWPWWLVSCLRAVVGSLGHNFLNPFCPQDYR
jgi:hypothetical protein